MSRSKSSHRWLKEHFSDEYVMRAKKEGWRSRAAYKLLEMQKKDNFIKQNQTIVDLGAAPGGWSQVAARLVGHKGRVVALDLLKMDGLAGVEFIQGDFSEQAVYDQLLATLDQQKVDWVISDIAPNLSGQKIIDQPKMMYLVELVFDFARSTLKPGGGVITKVFQGEGFAELMKALRPEFQSVKTRKPDASRARSSELYLVAEGFR